MNRKRDAWIGAALGALFAVMATGLARASNSDSTPTLTEEFHQTYQLAANGSVKLKNINGPVHVVGWDRNEVKVDAVKRAWTQEALRDAKIVVESAPDNIYVWTQYPYDNTSWTDRDCDDANGRCRHNPATVDYTISVPRGARLARVEAINGSLDISGVTGDVHASAINGRLTASGLASGADLSTVNSKLEASFDRIGTGPVSVGSVNGGVTVTIPSDASLDVSASTLNGGISNDFGLPVQHGRYVGHKLAGKLAQGGTELKLKNVNGGINIRHASDGKPVSAATSSLPPGRDRDW